MYEAFRNNNEKLPGDEEQNLNKPSVTLYLYPLESDDVSIALPCTDSPMIIVQENMTIEALTKYISTKLNTQENEIMVMYKNQEMMPDNTIDEIKRLYGFTEEKVIFNYARKPNNKVDSPSLQK